MKIQIKNLLFVGIALLLATISFSQKLIDKDSLWIDSTLSLKTENDVIIGKPSAYDFVNIEEEKNKFSISKIANVAGLAGSVVGLAGAEVGSVNAVRASATVLQGAATASSVGMTADAINSLNVSDKAKQIIGKKFRILKFKEEGNYKRGFHYYATVAGEGKTNYKIEIIPAIQSKEVIGVNGRLFDNPNN